MTLFSTFFISLLVSMLLVPPLMRYSRVLGLVDVAEPRKVHQGVIPRSGGIAIVVGALVPIFIWWPDEQLVRAMIAGSLVIVVFGFLDDRNGLHFAWKFFGQFLAVAIVMAAGLRIEVLPFFGIEAVPEAVSIPVTALFLVGVTNAINLSDGLDGLAAGTSLIALAAIAWLFYQSGAVGMAVLALAVLGGVCGFLRYNNHPALIFMGDTGSQFLGFMTAVLAVILTQHTNRALNPALLLLLLGLPILDTLAVMIWRIRRGRSPFKPYRNHFHHRLLDFGFRHYEAVSVIYLVQAALVAVAVFVRFESDAMVVGVYLVFCAIVLAGFRFARTRGFRIHRAADEGGRQERRNLLLRRIKGLPEIMSRSTEVLAAVFLVFAAFYPASVDPQLGIFGLVVAAVLLCSRMLPATLPDSVARITVYIAGVCAVFVLISEPRLEVVKNWHINAYMLLLAGCLILAIRLVRRNLFRTTPLDLLIVFFVVTVVIATTIYGESAARYSLADTTIRLSVFFYASEFLCSPARRGRRLLPLAALISLSILAARGLG